ncbi:MAG: hypothetical protein ABI353_22125 [Isosphaeraceae bacterium]
MLCKNYEHLWNLRLDAGSASDPTLDRALDEHAEVCAPCRLIAQRYRVLQRALSTLGSPVSPSLEFADRVLAAQDGLETAPRPIRLVRSPIRWAAAAAVAASLLAAVALTARVEPQNNERPALPQPPVLASRSLDEALAEATSATLALARATTDPAGRVGRRMLDAATVPDAVPALPTNLATSPEVLRTVGGRVGSGVRPLSGTARQAFSFLLVEAK